MYSNVCILWLLSSTLKKNDLTSCRRGDGKGGGASFCGINFVVSLGIFCTQNLSSVLSPSSQGVCVVTNPRFEGQPRRTIWKLQTLHPSSIPIQPSCQNLNSLLFRLLDVFIVPAVSLQPAHSPAGFPFAATTARYISFATSGPQELASKASENVQPRGNRRPELDSPSFGFHAVVQNFAEQRIQGGSHLDMLMSLTNNIAAINTINYAADLSRKKVL